MQKKNILIIGGGLVGLATAFRIQEAFPSYKITLLEKENAPAMHQSGHNSGVIHSGIYYPPHSAKAKNCIEGYQLLVDFCRKYDIAHQITGKLIVATHADEAKQLTILEERGRANGLAGLKKMSAAEAKEIEPHVNAHEALFVPQTGIVDFKAMANKLVELLRATGAEILFNQEVKNIVLNGNKVLIQTHQSEFSVDYAINCAGLQSDRIAKMAGAKIQHRIIPFKGEYYLLNETAQGLVNGLIYPVPNPGLPFLGVHLTKMIDGKVEAGPNAILALKREGYKKGDFKLKDTWETLSYPGFWKMATQFSGMGFNEWKRAMSKERFVHAVQQLVPAIENKHLVSASAGIRAQALSSDGKLIDEFLILSSPGMTHVCNAPSPAATSCLSIGNQIAKLVGEKLK